MKYLPAILILGCEAVPVPPAMPNPVLQAVPLCAASLTDEQLATVQAGFAQWQTALPELKIPNPSRKCLLPEPSVRVDPDDLPPGKAGYTTHKGIRFSSGNIPLCLATHEAGHWLGLVRHAPKDETGPMSDGDRGDCKPSPQDVAILRRTYLGKVSH